MAVFRLVVKSARWGHLSALRKKRAGIVILPLFF